MSVNNPLTNFLQIAQQLMQPKQAVQPAPAAPGQLLPWADNRQLPTRPGPATAAAPTPVPGDTQAQQARLERISARHVPRYASYTAAAAQPANGYMPFPTVERGRIQEILFLSVYNAADPTVSPNGTAQAFISTQVPIDSATIAAIPNVWAASGASPGAFPFTASPSRRQKFLHENERVIILFKGLANNSQMVGVLDVIDYEYSSWLDSLKAS